MYSGKEQNYFQTNVFYESTFLMKLLACEWGLFS